MSSGLNFTSNDAHRAADKIGIPEGKKRADHRTAWYWLDGRKRVRVSIPRHRCGESTRKNIVNSLRLSNHDFKRLYECLMTKSDFEKHIRGLIQAGVL